MKIALVRLTAMGDVIHTAASVQFIKAALPQCELTWFVEEKFAPILEHNPQIDRIVALNLHSLKKGASLRKIKALAGTVRSSGPLDSVIDVQGLVKSAVVGRLAGRDLHGLDHRSAREGVASLLYRHRHRVDCAGIAPMRFASLIAQSLGIEISREMMAGKKPYLFFDPEKDQSRIDTFFKAGQPNLLIITGASLPSKTYPTEGWIEVIRELEGVNILLVAGSTDERREAEKIAEATTARLLPPLDLDGLKYAVSRAEVLLGGDTGPSHIAWAMNRPSILLFGSTPPTMMFETERNIAITSGADVHPCRFDKNDRSIANIPPGKILGALERML
ncbi:lipopolysaccharide heptosyltransferase I [Nitratifractor salsuginis]|uniref:Lipopolysaccharide heptosyltransferase 1 n=1 Tax=Nitratifractor salsuginis (strain DSM 16511 / JCM 12458 / E9I37-1) TaxID=749222 RepID=E6WZC8_NITSE|nr:lipopolysaccharide heptosyltransferase I [Nitratifractor salsuginis]ADV46640.1 lipopolysaccharide heptosyltransferase I [Nitratifractor salsuginis DSM 16511]